MKTKFEKIDLYCVYCGKMYGHLETSDKKDRRLARQNNDLCIKCFGILEMWYDHEKEINKYVERLFKKT